MAFETPLLSSVQMNEFSVKKNSLSISNITRETIDEIASNPTLEISKANTVLHQLFGAKTGNKITKMLYIPCTLSLITTVLIIWVILTTLFNMNFVPYDINLVLHIIIYSIIFIYLLLLLLSLNKITTSLILTTFEFWLKMEFLVQFIICHSLCEEYKVFGDIVSHIFFNIILFIYVLVLCLIDGSQISFKVKAILFCLGGLLLTFGSFYWTVMKTETHIASIKLPFNAYSFNLDYREWAASSIRFLTIFTWKQAIYAIFKAPKSSIIKASINIKWV